MPTPFPADDNWKRYLDSVAETRKLLFSQPWSNTTHDQDCANYYFLQLQAVAFNLFVGARPGYPTLHTHLASEPNVYSWGIPTADFIYRYGVLDGARRYRIWGTRGSSKFLDFQLFRGTWGLPGGGSLANIDIDQFTKADGTFEVFIGEGTDHPLDPTKRLNMVLGREAFLDPDDVAARVHIDIADDKGRGDVVITAAEMDGKLQAAAAFVHLIISQFAIANNDQMLAAGPINQFVQSAFGLNAGAANNPAAYYPSFIYDLKDDEALILEWDVPKTFKYWNIQLSDIWHQATDFIYHQSALNAREVAVDADSRVRVVLSLKDPGVANWLDPVGLAYGFVICRFYHCSNVVEPDARKVKLANLMAELPEDTVTISPEGRKKVLERRALILRERFGY